MGSITTATESLMSWLPAQERRAQRALVVPARWEQPRVTAADFAACLPRSKSQRPAITPMKIAMDASMKVPAAPVVDVILPPMKSAIILTMTAMVRSTKTRRAPMVISAHTEPVEAPVRPMKTVMDPSCVVMGSVWGSVTGSSAPMVRTVVEVGVGLSVKE